MTCFLTLDINNGLLFNKRRLSQDKVVTQDIMNYVQSNNARLFLTSYSRKIFPDNIACEFTVCDAPYDISNIRGSSNCIFAENLSPIPHIDSIDKLVIYYWNKEYPSDVRFDINPEEFGFRLSDCVDYSSNTHPRITRLIFSRYV